MMRIEVDVQPGPVPAGWCRVVDDDGSTVAFCPDVATAQAVVEAVEIRQYLIERCRRTCAGRENYRGRARHEPNCPAYNLGLVE